MTIYVGIDDTDNLESRGTGRLARGIAAELSRSYSIYGVTRHQLHVHPDIPCTSHNSSAVIHVQGGAEAEVGEIFCIVRELMLSDFVEGSDPGLAVSAGAGVTTGVMAFGLDAKRSVVDKRRALDVARHAGLVWEELGGTGGGIIGAVAGIGLAATGSDGRFLMKGHARDLKGSIRSLSEVLASGIDQVVTVDGRVVEGGSIDLGRSANPSFVHGRAVLFVEERDGALIALKRD